MKELALKAQSGDSDAYTQLFKDTERIIYKVARNYSIDEENYEDLVSLGLVIFCETLEKFDATKGKFSTMLWNICKYRFLTYLVRRQQYLAKVPAHLAELSTKLSKFKNEFAKKELRYPTDKECIEFLKVTKNMYMNIKSVESAKEKVGFDKVSYGISGNTTEAESINNIMVSQALSALTKRENQVIRAIYLYELPVTELSKILGISRARIYELRNKALKKMRNLLNVNIGMEM